MSYAEFLALFLLAPLVTGTFCLRRHVNKKAWLTLAGVSLLALIYTGPWDNAIISNGVWSYPHGRVIGVTLGRVPIEEFLFYVFQVFLTGLLTVYLLQRHFDGVRSNDVSDL